MSSLINFTDAKEIFTKPHINHEIDFKNEAEEHYNKYKEEFFTDFNEAIRNKETSIEIYTYNAFEECGPYFKEFFELDLKNAGYSESNFEISYGMRKYIGDYCVVLCIELDFL